MKKLMMAVMMMVAGAAVASTATTFAYQGVLRDESGQVLNTNTATIEFRLYEGVDATDAVWGRRMTLAIDTNGLFNAELSDSSGTAITGINVTIDGTVASTLENVIAHAEKNNQSVYVGLTVQNSSGEIKPRQKLLPVPMAGYAQNVRESKGDFTVGGTLTVNGTMSVQSGLTAQNVSIEGTASFNKAVQMESGATIGGSDVNATNLTVNGKMVAKGDVVLGDSAKILMNGKYEATMPIGSIIIWSGSPNASALPKGWMLCAPDKDGKPLYYMNPYSNTQCPIPDLRGRFVLGMNEMATDANGNSIKRNADFTECTVGSTGGVERVTLTVDQMPSHYHQYYGDDQLANIDTVKNAVEAYGYDASSGTGDGRKSQRYRTDSVGGGKSHENMPPFYALCYIIFVGDNLVK